jgi:tetratricopeptide (TPR) repeat protein
VAVIVLVFVTLVYVGSRLGRRIVIGDGFRRVLGKGAAWALCAVLVVVLAQVSTNRARAFRSELALWEEAVNTRPNAVSYVWYGGAFAEKGDLPAAVRQFRKAIELDPDLAQAYSNMGAALLLMRKPEEAMTYLQIALAKKPDFADAANNLAEAYLRSGRFDEAIAQASRAIQLQPDMPQPRRILAEALQRKEVQSRRQESP